LYDHNVTVVTDHAAVKAILGAPNFTGRHTGRKQKPLLQPIQMERPFQILGVDIVELPITSRGNQYVIVF